MAKTEKSVSTIYHYSGIASKRSQRMLDKCDRSSINESRREILWKCILDCKVCELSNDKSEATPRKDRYWERRNGNYLE